MLGEQHRREAAARLQCIQQTLVQSLSKPIRVREQAADSYRSIVGRPCRTADLTRRNARIDRERVLIASYRDGRQLPAVHEERDVVAVGRPRGARDTAAVGQLSLLIRSQ